MSSGLDGPRLRMLARYGEARIIRLRDLALTCSIGIHAFEKAAPQRVLINVELFTAPGTPEADEIAHVLDYDFLRTRIKSLAEGRHFNLQETLLDEIMAICLLPAAVVGARVSTEKPDVYPDCAGVGLEAIRFKPEAE